MALAGDMLEYVSSAKANLAWVSYHEGDLSRTLAYGLEAMEIWKQSPLVYPFQWTALWPLIGVALAKNQISEAVENVRLMLQPTQQLLPDTLTEILDDILEQWERGNLEMTRNLINEVVELAQAINWF
jgi:hypothetical protein